VYASLCSGGRRTIAQDQTATSPRVGRQGIYRDLLAIALFVFSLAGVAALVGYVTIWLPWLPPYLPLHYNGVGSVDLIGPKTDLYKMPGIGAAVLLADIVLAVFLHHRERWAALSLLGMSVLVQIILLVGTINIVRLAFGD
jgi:hypothetical protein